MIPNVYRVNAVPTLDSEGEFTGYIEYVTFTATLINSSRSLHLSRRYYNDGTYPEIFCHLMSSELSASVLLALRDGRSVKLAGFYTGAELTELGFDNLDDVSVPKHDRLLSLLAS